MNAIGFDFNLAGIDPFVAGGDPLPSGQYVMAISNMEVKPNNKAESGHNLACEYTVVEGEFKGRKVYDNLNLWHKTSTGAVEIAWKQLSSIGHAVGVLQGNDLTQLANKPMLVEVTLDPGKEATIDANGQEVKATKPRNSIVRRDAYSTQQAAVSAPQAAAAAQAPAFNPAAQQQAAAAQAQPAAAVQAQVAAPSPAPAAQAAPTGTPGASTPPWLAGR